MPSGTRRILSDTGTTGAIAFTIDGHDDFDLPIVTMQFDSAPSSAGNITLTHDSAEGSDYDAVLETINPVGHSSVAVYGLKGFANGDKVVIAYANPDNRDWFIAATIDLGGV
jgi:hypothetical protein